MTDQPALPEDLEPTPYRAVRPLARGGMGEVWVVEHSALAELRVMKILHGSLAANVEAARRLHAEARLLTRVRHPNLVRVLDFGFTASHRPYLVSELLDGETLHVRLTRVKQLSVDQTIDLALQVLDGLDAVHSADLVHRDIKPDNLFLARERGTEVLKILDFGIAKVMAAELRAVVGQAVPTADGAIFGTPRYMSPEQIVAAPTDHRADLYALGCVLYRCVSGQTPFAGSIHELLHAHVREQPQPLSTFSENVPAPFDDLVMRALAKDPEERFESAVAMKRILRSTGKQPEPKRRAGRGHTVRMEVRPVWTNNAEQPTAFGVVPASVANMTNESRKEPAENEEQTTAPLPQPKPAAFLPTTRSVLRLDLLIVLVCLLTGLALVAYVLYFR